MTELETYQKGDIIQVTLGEALDFDLDGIACCVKAGTFVATITAVDKPADTAHVQISTTVNNGPVVVAVPFGSLSQYGT